MYLPVKYSVQLPSLYVYHLCWFDVNMIELYVLEISLQKHMLELPFPNIIVQLPLYVTNSNLHFNDITVYLHCTITFRRLFSPNRLGHLFLRLFLGGIIL